MTTSHTLANLNRGLNEMTKLEKNNNIRLIIESRSCDFSVFAPEWRIGYDDINAHEATINVRYRVSVLNQ